jgi:hypothetical protein
MATGTKEPLPAETVDEAGDAKVLSVRDAVRSLRGMLGPCAKGRLLTDELIEERRREAQEEGS